MLFTCVGNKKKYIYIYTLLTLGKGQHPDRPSLDLQSVCDTEQETGMWRVEIFKEFIFSPGNFLDHGILAGCRKFIFSPGNFLDHGILAGCWNFRFMGGAFSSQAGWLSIWRKIEEFASERDHFIQHYYGISRFNK